MESLLNESKLNLKRGQMIKFYNKLGKVKIAKYLMAGEKEGTVVVCDYDSFGGSSKVINLSDIVKIS